MFSPFVSELGLTLAIPSLYFASYKLAGNTGNACWLLTHSGPSFSSTGSVMEDIVAGSVLPPLGRTGTSLFRVEVNVFTVNQNNVI